MLSNVFSPCEERNFSVVKSCQHVSGAGQVDLRLPLPGPETAEKGC
jgi:hypothetical protein